MTDPSPSPRDAAARAGVTLRLLWPQWQGPGRLAGLHAWTEDDVPNIARWGIASFSPDDLRATTRPLLDWLGAEPGDMIGALFTASGKPSVRPWSYVPRPGVAPARGGCAMLSNRQQIARLRHLAGQALGAYPLVDPELRFVAHGENTTFRVDAMVADGPDRFLLRVHRPARHGRRLDSAAAVGSELDWLTALRADTGLSVPEPFRTTSGKLTTTAASTDMPEPRVCSLLRWMDGRVHSSAPRLVHLRRLGSVMARLHNHAGQWCPPPGFARIRWDWETFFGDTMVYGGINAADAWDLIPADLRRRFDRVASGMQRVMTHLGDGADQVGLIHADLHLDNALFWRDDVRIIDFDDCGFGYWLYDIAVPLWELRHRSDYEQFRTALIEGYTQHRPLPPGGLTHLDDFIATREVAFGLWYAGTAEVNPAFRADLSEVLGHIGHSLDTLLGD